MVAMADRKITNTSSLDHPPMKKTVCYLIASLALLTAPESAHADVISYQFGSLNDFIITELDYTGTLGLFDSNLGTLTSATLTLSEAYTTTVTLTNIASTDQTGRYRSEIQSFWSSSLFAVDDLINVDPTDKLLLSTGMLTLQSNVPLSIGPQNETYQQTYDLTSMLAELTRDGGGLFTVNLQTLTGSTLMGGGGNVNSDQDTSGAVHGIITYTYSTVAVPEPSSVFLIASTGLGLILRRKRRFSGNALRW